MRQLHRTLGLALLLGLAACEKGGAGDVVTLQSPVKVNQQALDEQMARARAQQEAFSAEGREHLATLDRKIEALKERASQSKDQARQAADEALAKLKVERESASAALERAQNASAESWESVKEGAKQALGKAEQTYNETLQKLKSD